MKYIISIKLILAFFVWSIDQSVQGAVVASKMACVVNPLRKFQQPNLLKLLSQQQPVKFYRSGYFMPVQSSFWFFTRYLASLVKAPIRVPALQQKASEPWSFLENTSNQVCSDPRLLWSNVRMADNTNCGYHALKNIKTLMNALNFFKVEEILSQPKIQSDLQSLPLFLNDLSYQVEFVHQKREKDIKNNLARSMQLNNRSIDDALTNSFLKKTRNNLSACLRSYVNANDGHIKTDYLGAGELESLISEKESVLKNDILIFEYLPGQDTDFWLFDKNKDRLNSFNQNKNDTLGVLWTEDGFGHWVGYVAAKRDGKVTIFELNSIESFKPKHKNVLLDLLKS